MKYKITILLATILLLTGCKTSKKLEYTRYEYDSTAVTKIAEQAIHRYTQSEEHVYDSTSVNYMVGKVDSVTLIRVDTIVKYRYRNKVAKEATQDTVSTASSVQECQTKAAEEKKVVETTKRSWFNGATLLPWLLLLLLVIIVCKRFVNKLF